MAGKYVLLNHVHTPSGYLSLGIKALAFMGLLEALVSVVGLYCFGLKFERSHIKLTTCFRYNHISIVRCSRSASFYQHFGRRSTVPPSFPGIVSLWQLGS